MSCDMRIVRRLLAAALLAAPAAQAGAQELPVLGQGNLPCTDWLDRRAAAAAEAETMTAWVLGYLTAYNQYAADPQEDVSGGQEPEQLTAWLDEYCRENATANLYTASAALVEDLRQDRREQ
jgi:hypothetical protein